MIFLNEMHFENYVPAFGPPKLQWHIMTQIFVEIRNYVLTSVFDINQNLMIIKKEVDNVKRDGRNPASSVE